MTQHWAWQFGKLSSAVGVLVSHPGNARQRVWASARYLMQISPDCVPPQCKDDVAWIRHMLTRHPKGPYDESDLQATHRRSRCTTACKIAERVWHTYHVYADALDSPEYLESRATTGIVIVPPKALGA